MEGTFETCRIPSCCKSCILWNTGGGKGHFPAADEETFYSKYHKEVLLEESYKNALKLFCGR